MAGSRPLRGRDPAEFAATVVLPAGVPTKEPLSRGFPGEQTDRRPGTQVLWDTPVDEIAEVPPDRRSCKTPTVRPIVGHAGSPFTNKARLVAVQLAFGCLFGRGGAGRRGREAVNSPQWGEEHTPGERHDERGHTTEDDRAGGAQ